MAIPFNEFAGTTGIGTTGGGNGHTAFGTVPGPISVAPNKFSQVQNSIPGFNNLTSGTSNVIGSELSGQVSPNTLNALRTAAAQWGVNSGMPGSGLQQNNLFGNIAGYSEKRQHQGLEDYLGTLSTVGNTMTDPALATEVSNRNALFAAAPDPQKAAQQQLAEWMQKFNLTRSSNYGGGPGGGTGVYSGGGGGGFRSGKFDALGNPIGDYSNNGGSLYNSPSLIGYGPQDGGTQHFAAGAGGSINPALLSRNNLIDPGGELHNGNYNYDDIDPFSEANYQAYVQNNSGNDAGGEY